MVDETSNPMKDMIADLRGGYPEKCGFCGQPMTPEEAVPEEAGEWACIRCWDRWEAEARVGPQLKDGV